MRLFWGRLCAARSVFDWLVRLVQEIWVNIRNNKGLGVSCFLDKANSKSMHISCRRIILPWTGENLVSQGHNIRVADKDRGFRGPVVIEPKGRFEAEYVAGKELLPDDYEVFFYLTSGNLSSVPGPMSDRLSFDVVERKQEARTAEPSAPTDADNPRR